MNENNLFPKFHLAKEQAMRKSMEKWVLFNEKKYEWFIISVEFIIIFLDSSIHLLNVWIFHSMFIQTSNACLISRQQHRHFF